MQLPLPGKRLDASRPGRAGAFCVFQMEGRLPRAATSAGWSRWRTDLLARWLALYVRGSAAGDSRFPVMCRCSSPVGPCNCPAAAGWRQHAGNYGCAPISKLLFHDAGRRFKIRNPLFQKRKLPFHSRETSAVHSRTAAAPRETGPARHFSSARARTRLQPGILASGLNVQSDQADRAVLELLRAFGAEVQTQADGILVRGAPLHGTSIDAGPIPDLIPAIAAVAALARGKSRDPQRRKAPSQRIRPAAHRRRDRERPRRAGTGTARWLDPHRLPAAFRRQRRFLRRSPHRHAGGSSRRRLQRARHGAGRTMHVQILSFVLADAGHTEETARAAFITARFWSFPSSGSRTAWQSA